MMKKRTFVATALATALQQFNSRPDAFAGIARLPGSALSLRINHPVDDMRKAGMVSFLNLIRDEISAKLKNGATGAVAWPTVHG